MEAVPIRRKRYALIREDHLDFYNPFDVHLFAEELILGGDGGIGRLVQAISKRVKVMDADWQRDHSKIFIRRELSEKSERLITKL